MTNFEKYKTELRKLGCGVDFKVDTNLKISQCEDCYDCIFNDEEENCDFVKLEWLYEDAERPRLTKEEILFLKKINPKCFYVIKNDYSLLFYDKEHKYLYNLNCNIFSKNSKINFDGLVENRPYAINEI